jgi:hypothetical protein
MQDVFTVYETLWLHAEALGATVLYDGFMPDGAGGFHPDPTDLGEPSPTITIGRPFYEQIGRPARNRNIGGRDNLPPPDLLREVTTLAHEMGHFLSWKERTPRGEWNRYFLAATTRDRAWESVDQQGSVAEYNDRRRAASRTALTGDEIELIRVQIPDFCVTQPRVAAEVLRRGCASGLAELQA